jgi:murein L,D-transpeptidase YafK
MNNIPITLLTSLQLACTNTNIDISEEVFEEIRSQKPNLLVDKSERLIFLIRDGDFVTDPSTNKALAWKISLGKDPIGHKNKIYDQKTPEGLYDYTDKPVSKYYGSLWIHYPKESDTIKALKEGRIKKSEKKDIIKKVKTKQPPPDNSDLGGNILIHGIHKKGSFFGTGYIRYPQTDGCIGLDNNSMDELRAELESDNTLDFGQVFIIP